MTFTTKVLTLLMSILLSMSSHAHLMPKGKGTINIEGKAAYAVLSIPVKAFKGVDDNRDGLMDARELNKHQKSIRAQFKAMVSLVNQNDTLQWQEILLSLSTQGAHNNKPSADLLFMAVGHFKQPPKEFEVQLPLWKHLKSETLTLHATISDGARTLAKDLQTMSSKKRTHTFFEKLNSL